METLSTSLGLLTLLVTVLGCVLLFTVVRLLGRMQQREPTPAVTEATFVADALHEAVSKLRTQERAQQARAEASERLNADIVRNLTAGLLVVKADGRVSSVNPAATTLIGVDASHVGRAFDEVLGPAVEVAGVIAEGLRTGYPSVRRSVDLRALQPLPGAAAVLGVSVSPLFSNEGVFEGVICLLTDLSAVHELESQLRLKEGLAALGELGAGIAHEFRNGLATIHGYARLMPVERLPPELQPHVRGIQQETEALGRVVTRFLEFAKPAPLLVAPIVVRDIVEAARREIQPALDDAGGTIDIDTDGTVVDGDAVLLQRAVSNVLRNALDACARVPVRPRLTVRCRETAAPAGVSIHVLDNGSGFTRESESRAFEPFFTTRRDGTGLGLALVQKFVVLHGGRVQVQNRDSSGADVRLWLPRHPL